MERDATIDDRTVRYLDAGSGDPIVLLHGFPLSADMWRPQSTGLPEGWRLIAPDLRGFGRSARRRGVDAATDVPARAMDAYAHDVLALLDQLGIDRAVVGGLSMGGYVTFALCRLAPGRVRALVLADTRAEADSDEARRNREAMLAALEAKGPAAVADTMLPKMIGAVARREQPELEHYVRRIIEASDPAAIADAIRCMMTRPDSTSVLESIGVPALLLVGRDDQMTPVALHEHMQSLLGGASLTIIEGAGHLANLEQPDVFNRSLARFLRSLG